MGDGGSGGNSSDFARNLNGLGSKTLDQKLLDKKLKFQYPVSHYHFLRLEKKCH